MYKVSDFTKNYYKPSEVADLFNVSAQTIRNRVQAGELTCIRTEGGHRLITRESLLSYLKSSNMLYEDTANDKYDVIYARVSSHEQKEKGDLDRQVSCIIEHMQGLSNVLVLKEVGSGLNDKRKQLLKLLRLVFEGKVRTVCITYRDRLTRFGFNYLKFIFDVHNVNGGGNKAKTEMQEVVKQLVNYSYAQNKALIIEKLKFSKKKSGTLHNKTYNSMLHRLDYSRFAQLCENSATLYGVQLVKVNPAYTSIVARQKYCKTRKLNIHCGAAYVIARRGQGFSDKIA